MSPSYSPPISKPIRSSLLIILFLGAAIRLVGIDAPLYGDELATTSLWAQMPLLEIPSHYEYPNNHIFHTLLVAVILKVFGLHPFLLRLPVLVCGVASLALAFFTAHRITRSGTAALAVSFLLAISGGHIFYSTNARGYMLILLIAQLLVHRLVIWFDEAEFSMDVSSGGFSLKELLLCGVLLMMGTWTLPTFALFEASLGVFFIGLLIFQHRGRWVGFSFPHMQVLAVLLLCLGGLYIQYYVFISPEMRELALSNSAQTDLTRLHTEILWEWIRPFESVGVIFMFLAVVGLYVLLQLNPILFYLIVCVLVLPPVGIYTVCLLGLAPVTPHARIFFYLQPVFVLCAVVGTFTLIYRLKARLGPRWGKAAVKILPWVLAVSLTIFSVTELAQVTWPERFARQPLDRVAAFVEKLGPNDLVLLSTRSHVEFYLYGAGEMQKRVERILDEGKLDDIYFVQYEDRGGSDTEKFRKEGVDYLRLSDYYQIVASENESAELLLPTALFEPATRIGNFSFRKVKRGVVENGPALRSPADWRRWRQTADSAKVTLVPPAMHRGDLPALEFSGPGSLVAETELARPELARPELAEPELKEGSPAFAININLMNADREAGAGASYLHAVERDGKYVSGNAWAVNEWVLDHPYGPGIHNRPWRARIFLTAGNQPVEIIRAQGIEPGTSAHLRGIQTYRLVLTTEELLHSLPKS